MELVILIALVWAGQTAAQTTSVEASSNVISIPPTTASATYTASTIANTSASSDACVPARGYPDNHVCVYSDGQLTLVSLTTTATAPSVSESALGDCQSEYRICMSSSAPQQALCNTQLINCKGTCASQRETCTSSEGADAPLCASIYAECLGSDASMGNITTVSSGIDGGSSDPKAGTGNSTYGGGGNATSPSGGTTPPYTGTASSMVALGVDSTLAVLGCLAFILAL